MEPKLKIVIVHFNHNDTEYECILRNNRCGGVVETPKDGQRWMTLLNANVSDVIEYLKEKNIPISHIESIVPHIA